MPNGHLKLKNPRTGLCMLALVASAYSYVGGQTDGLKSPSVELGMPIVQLESLPAPPRLASQGEASQGDAVIRLGKPVATPTDKAAPSSIVSTPPPPPRVMRVAGFEGHETYARPRAELYPSPKELSRPALALQTNASVSLGTPQPAEAKRQDNPTLALEKNTDPQITLDRPVATVDAHGADRSNSAIHSRFPKMEGPTHVDLSSLGNTTLNRPVPVRPVGDTNETLAELAIPELGFPVPAPDSSALPPEASPAARPELSFDDLLSESISELAIPDESTPPAPQSAVGMDAIDALPESLLRSEDNDDLLLGTQEVEELPRPAPKPSPTPSNAGQAGQRSGSVPSYSPEDALGLPSLDAASPNANLPPSSGRDSNFAAPLPSDTNTSEAGSADALDKPKYDGPYFFEPMGKMTGPRVDTLAKQVPYQADTFMPPPIRDLPVDPVTEGSVYRGKFPVTVQRPLIELWRPLYTSGIYPEAKNWFGDRNLVMPHFMVYGDFRTGVGINRNAQGDTHNLAFRANLDMDLEITATERIHAFMGPLDRGGDFTKLEFANSADWVNRTDMRLDTLFFEGDVGSILAGMRGEETSLDLPFSFGFLPFFYQNGIWANDNALGAAFALPARHSRLLNWSNYDATFFWASDQINSDAFPGDNNAAEFFGTAWFIEAYDGYIEANYAFVHDDVIDDRSYHNLSFAFTRRYLQRLSNSIRYITNVGQNLPSDQRTADGHLILIENSLISSTPNTFVPYLNFFYGQGRTQSLARAGIAGGILNNTGINFENDGLTGYPTLDATGVNATGAAVGLNMLGASFEQQLIVEFAALAANGDAQFRNAPGDQYAIGMRYQRPLNNAWIFRTDHMFGFLRNADDIRGSRVELRMKF